MDRLPPSFETRKNLKHPSCPRGEASVDPPRVSSRPLQGTPLRQSPATLLCSIRPSLKLSRPLNFSPCGYSHYPHSARPPWVSSERSPITPAAPITLRWSAYRRLPAPASGLQLALFDRDPAIDPAKRVSATSWKTSSSVVHFLSRTCFRPFQTLLPSDPSSTWGFDRSPLSFGVAHSIFLLHNHLLNSVLSRTLPPTAPRPWQTGAPSLGSVQRQLPPFASL